MSSPVNATPASRRVPFNLLIKPTGAACNLDCSYCFFLSKEALWNASAQRMSKDTLEQSIRAFLDAQPDGDVVLGWQGGEPTMRGLGFFAEAVAFAESIARPRQRLMHSIQTNATLLDDEWGEFLAEKKFLVGVSIDGPRELHDRYRVNKAGRGTYDQVIRGWRVLEKHGVERNVLCTVNSSNADHPLEVYRHFRDDLGANYIQFIPIVERVEQGAEDLAENSWRDADGEYVLYRQSGAGVTSRTVRPEQYGDFLCAVFDEWFATDVGRISVQDFETVVGARLGMYSLCVHAPECGRAIAMEHNGEVYSCDHFVEPAYDLGNIHEESLSDLLLSPKQIEFGRSKRTSLPDQCLACPVRWACNGGCPKDRFVDTGDPARPLNYLCGGYKRFFGSTASRVDALALLVSRGRPASEVMELNLPEAGRARDLSSGPDGGERRQ